MSLSFIIIRTLLGLIFTIGGFLLSRKGFFERHPLFDLPYFGETLSGFLAGALGIFAVPFLAAAIKNWFVTLIQVTVQTTVARSVGALLAAQTKRLGEIKKSKERERKESQLLKFQQPAPPVILDTSAIIDGRIFDVMGAGFLPVAVILPSFTLDELQKLADSSSDLKRQRGRRGLELLEEAKKEKKIKLTIWKEKVAGKDVDEKLANLAKRIEGKIATVDFNLNKTASVLGISVLNVNDLANLIKTPVLPGENLKIKVVQKGKEAGQGVGFLDDGTMVVIEDGGELLGREVKVKVTRLLQTSAGKMIFARTSSTPRPRLANGSTAPSRDLFTLRSDPPEF